MHSFGVSFSIKYARELDVNPRACLEAALKDLGARRLRLMSYWDIHEQKQGVHDFGELDWQFDLAKKYGAKVSLAIGLRQPRWPESHWPAWTKDLDATTWQQYLLNYIETTVRRYRNHPSLQSWQLENEALLKSFGLHGNYDRRRLQQELQLVKQTDNMHPVIMTMSDSWGIPVRKPWPDIFGISLYRRFYDRGAYRYSRRPAWFYALRGRLITLLTGRPVFIHELQMEPWGPKATVELSHDEQRQTMNPDYFNQTVAYAAKTGKNNSH